VQKAPRCKERIHQQKNHKKKERRRRRRRRKKKGAEKIERI